VRGFPRLALIGAVWLGLVGPSFATPPTVEIPLSREDLFQVQTRPFAPGARYRYLAETRVHEAGGALPATIDQTSRTVFEIEIVSIDPASGQPVLRYVLREVTIVDPSQPGIQQIMAALVGVPVEFHTVAGLHTSETLNSPAVRTQVLTNLERAANGDAALLKTMTDLLDQLLKTPEGLSGWMAADVDDLAGMYAPLIPKAPVKVPTATTTLEDGSVMVNDSHMAIVSADSVHCIVTYDRETRIKISSKDYDEVLSSRASLANDGLPVVLTQTETRSAADNYRFRETLTLTRQGPPPGCN
jgi:hypothetical protein